MQQRREPQRLAAGQLVRQRPLQLPRQARRRLAEHATQIALDLEQRLQDRQRVTPDVQVVIRVLLDSLLLFELGKQYRHETCRAHQLYASQDVVRDQKPAELVEDSLGGNARDLRRALGGEHLCACVDRKAKFAGEAGPCEACGADRRGTHPRSRCESIPSRGPDGRHADRPAALAPSAEMPSRSR